MKALHLMKTRKENTDEAPTPRKKRKAFRRILITLVILLIVAILTVQYGLGFIVGRAAKSAGPSVIGTEIKIGKAYVRPFFGIVDLSGMVVGPPQGFKANVFEMEGFRIVVDTGSIFSDTLIIKEITILDPLISYELSGLNSNISAILDKLRTTEKAEDEAERNQKAGRKVIIESFILRGAKIRIAATLTGGKGVVIPMPDLILKDIGKHKGGITALDAFSQTLKAVAQGVIRIIKNAPLKIGSLAVDGVTLAGSLAIDGAKAAGNFAADGARAVGGVAVAAGGLAADGAKAAGSFAVDTASSVGSATLGAAGSAGKAAVGTAGAVGGAVADGATTAGHVVVKNVKAVGGAAADTVGTVGGALLDGARTIGEATVDTASAVGGAVVGGVKTVGSATLDTAGALGGAAVSGVKTVGGAVVGGAKAVGGAITGMFTSSDTTNAVPEETEKAEKK